VPGGSDCSAAGDYSFAAGRHANATQDGAFVWADSTDADLTSTETNTFVVRASGGIWFGTTSSPSTPSGRFINTSTGGYLSTGGVWTDVSDRNAKEHFTPVDSKKVLEQVAALPITRWNYKAEQASVQHIGPVAQDFHAAFDVGQDDRHLSALDGNGVALAAIQGLNQKLTQELKRRDAENAELKTQNQSLEKRLEALERVILGRKPN
jgi:hypothetical protein